MAASPRTRRAPDSIQCFRPGRHLAMSGALLSFAESDLEATAAAYDPALHEAPLVVGHPSTDAPAYGWVGALEHRAGALEALPRQVNAQFAELVNAGSYKKVSAAFWCPDAPGNPVPGVYYLRHVGFLGAAAPAVKGLRTPAFAGGEAGVVEFSAWDDIDNAGLLRALRDWILGKFGQDEADRAMPPYLLASIERGAQRELAEEAADSQPEPATIPASFAAPGSSNHRGHSVSNTPDDSALRAENEQLRQQLAAQISAERERRAQAAQAHAVAFADSLVAGGRLADGQRALVVELVARIARGEGDEGAVIHFGEGDERAPLLAGLEALLQGLPERAARDMLASSASAAGDQVEFAQPAAAPAGYTLSERGRDLHLRAQRYMAAHQGTDYVSALRAIERAGA